MNIVLVGFMGTGKSSVGKELSRVLGKRYIDVDEIIQKKENCSIPRIFAEKGEDYFRKIEEEVIREVSRIDESVISTGGGAVLKRENMENLKKGGIVICLKANLQTILERTTGDEQRPLLNAHLDRKERIKQLLKKRAPFYNKADIIIDTSSLSILQTVDRIVKILSPERLQVSLKEKSYPVFIGFSLDRIGEVAKDFIKGKKILVVSDTNVFPLYGGRIEDSLKKWGFEAYSFKVPAGERSKSLSKVKKIYDFCLKAGLDRTSSILALGGGVVGDLAGFAAATFLRGINFIIVPTTLLSQVDSGVGGKVGVNLSQGKNLVGAFYQPRFVLIDPILLRTLSLRRIREGMAEVIKCAIIENGGFFSYLERNISRILSFRDIGILRSIIEKAVEVKIKVVEEDEREEKGIRQVLNFGHTIAHAIEAVSKYGKYTHGEAVAIGMVGAAKIGKEMGVFSSDYLARLENLIKKTKLPVKAKGLNPEEILQALKVDKKVREGRLFFVVPEDIGRVSLRGDVPLCLVEKVIKELV